MGCLFRNTPLKHAFEPVNVGDRDDMHGMVKARAREELRSPKSLNQLSVRNDVVDRSTGLSSDKTWVRSSSKQRYVCRAHAYEERRMAGYYCACDQFCGKELSAWAINSKTGEYVVMSRCELKRKRSHAPSQSGHVWVSSDA